MYVCVYVCVCVRTLMYRSKDKTKQVYLNVHPSIMLLWQCKHAAKHVANACMLLCTSVVVQACRNARSQRMHVTVHYCGSASMPQSTCNTVVVRACRKARALLW